MLELYHSILSPCAQKVRLVLAEKKLPYQSHLVNVIAKENLQANYLRLNPNGVVPTLVHNGSAIIESTLICEYLEDMYPAISLRPANARAVVDMRIWTKLVDEKVHPAAGALMWCSVIRKQLLQTEATKEKAVAKIKRVPDRDRQQRQMRILNDGWNAPEAIHSVTTLRRVFEKMATALQHTPWLAGADLTLADLALAPYVQAIKQLQLSDPLLNGLPGLLDWFERLSNRSSFVTEIANKLPEDRIEMQRELGLQARPTVIRLLNSMSLAGP